MSDKSGSFMDSFQKTTGDLSNSVNAGLASAQKSATESYANVQSNMDDFSKSAATATSDSGFLDANGLIAKFAFLVLAIIVFLVALNLGIRLIYYFMNPQSSYVYLIKGMKDGTRGTTISQDPSISTSIVNRSNNQTSGIEFTWSVWLMLTGFQINTTTAYQPIFVKGGGTYNSAGVSAISNGPGVYFSTGKKNSIRILMDTVSTTTANEVAPSPNIIDIPNIPINKWFHLAVRCQNKYLDVYMNGIVAYRKDLNNIPLQNYNNVEVCQNGGFIGKISNLVYYNRSLNIIDINSIVYTGPDTTNAEPDIGVYGGEYLSTLWYPTS